VPRILESGNVPAAPAAEPVLSIDRGHPLQVDERVPLSLTADHGRLGLELTAPIEIGPLVIESLVLIFGNLRFPVDLSGGVPAFRHRRGQLQRVTLSIELGQLKRLLEPRLRSAVGELDRSLDLWVTDNGFGFGWIRQTTAITGELHWAPLGDDVRLVLANLRGVSSNNVVLAEALRALDSVLAGQFSRRGRIWMSPQVGRRLSRLVLPAAGARVPIATGLDFGRLLPDVDRVRTHLDAQLGELSLNPATVRALELAELVVSADDALVQGDLDLARQEYLRALEWAPRHKDLVLYVSELDLVAGGREHLALGFLNETIPAITAGALGAELLRITGDTAGAIEALDAATRSELYAPLRALLQMRKVDLVVDPRTRRDILDSAVAVAPTLSSVRWARFEARAAIGDVNGALEDAEYLETSASGSQKKHEVCVRCGNSLRQSGLLQQASKYFERALRLRPEGPVAAVGLARSFIDLGQTLRAISLLERAIQAGDSTTQPIAEAQMLLACLLAKEVNDLPQAIARVRQIPSSAQVATEARVWEARWRHALGDIVGASLAWSRMRELVEMGSHSDDAAKWLVEASNFERDVRQDYNCAERHLAIALRVSPRDELINASYREVAATLAATKEQ
jgi:cellulose synthase operon protein C